MKKCQDCDYFGGECKTSGNVCEKYKKTFYRTYTKLDEFDNGYYKFSKLEVTDDIK